MAKQDLYRRVDEALLRGEVWRAKEILRGNIGSGSYDSQLYERYGKLLMDLGELVEAGKYLFLSGYRSPQCHQAIETYLSRHPEDRPEDLYYSFPSAARFRELHRYPLEVRRTLEERGLSQHFDDLARQRIGRIERNIKRKGTRGQAYLRYGPLDVDSARAYHGHGVLPSAIRRQAIRVLQQGLLGAGVLLLAASAVVGVVTIVAWLVSLA